MCLILQVYLSDFGKERMAEEDMKGPKELVEQNEQETTDESDGEETLLCAFETANTKSVTFRVNKQQIDFSYNEHLLRTSSFFLYFLARCKRGLSVLSVL